nr:ligase-associated DNA damage response endonuclease PdeM [Afifella pfennigii]
MAETRLNLAGREVALDPAGALFDPQTRTLVVADLHLEKASSFARRQVFLPPYDTAATLTALTGLVLRRRPRTVLCLGDSFHDGEGAARLSAQDAARIAALQAGRDWVWIAGNHDPAPPAGLGGDCCAQVQIGPLAFRHEPTCQDGAKGKMKGEVAGHLHPSAKVSRRGRSIRRRAFVTDKERLVLPSFGMLTGGLNVLDRAFQTLFPPFAFTAFVLGEKRLYPVAPASLRPD